ncbi:hypothetical protein niasHS_012353 [Heterodera schachtii]|uniref:Uncharacterized protein n=1 Tax=Heterodera schachtii TaxID=97005 RepID=A0ABD2IME4_HETSC
MTRFSFSFTTSECDWLRLEPHYRSIYADLCTDQINWDEEEEEEAMVHRTDDEDINCEQNGAEDIQIGRLHARPFRLRPFAFRWHFSPSRPIVDDHLAQLLL